MKRSMMLSLLVVVFVVLVPVAGGCNSGPEPGDQNSYSQVFSSVSFTGSEEVSAAIDELVRESKIEFLRPGVWVAKKIVDRSRTEILPVPIEIIVDPVIAARVKNGLRPDGGLMYSYPESLPEGYSKKLFEYSIDIYPEEIPAGQGVEGGQLVLYGHFLNPPYKYQVVVVGRDDVRILVNGIDTGLPNPQKGRDEFKAKNKPLILSPNTYANRKSITKAITNLELDLLVANLLKESLSSVATPKDSIEIIRRVVEKRPYIFNVNVKQTQPGFYCLYFDSMVDRSKPLPEKKDLINKNNLWSHDVCTGGDTIYKMSSRKRIEDALLMASTKERALKSGVHEIDFGRRGLGITKQQYGEVSWICKTPRYSNEQVIEAYVSRVENILHDRAMSLYILANCGR